MRWTILSKISILLTLTWMAKCRASSTITAANPFNAGEDADKILAAVEGFGTDEQVFIDILTKRTCAQREEIRKTKDEAWISSIEQDFLLDEPALTVILSSMYCGPAFYRFHFKKCFEAGDAAGVAEMLSILSNQPDVLEIVKNEYFEAEQVTFDNAMSQAFTGDFLNWCSQVIMTKRDVQGAVDQGLADKEAAALVASISTWQTDRKKLQECLMKPSFMQVREILTKFKNLNNQIDLSTAITSAQFEDTSMTTAYLYMIHTLENELDFIVDRLKELTDANDGLGLTRLILARSEIDILEAKKGYQDKYKMVLSQKLQEILKDTQLSLLLGFLGEPTQLEAPESSEASETSSPPPSPSPSSSPSPSPSPSPPPE